MTEKFVLAYSGGLDTSVLIKYLQEKCQAEVITVTVDVGQQEDLAGAAEKAKKLGVLKHIHIDAKDEFVTDYIFPAIKANALYEGKYPISTSLSRPLIAKKMVEIAEKEGATTLVHGCTGRGNDQVRFDVTLGSLAPEQDHSRSSTRVGLDPRRRNRLRQNQRHPRLRRRQRSSA